jgi:hypothetical protein
MSDNMCCVSCVIMTHWDWFGVPGYPRHPVGFCQGVLVQPHQPPHILWSSGKEIVPLHTVVPQATPILTSIQTPISQLHKHPRLPLLPLFPISPDTQDTRDAQMPGHYSSNPYTMTRITGHRSLCCLYPLYTPHRPFPRTGRYFGDRKFSFPEFTKPVKKFFKNFHAKFPHYGSNLHWAR